MKSVMRSPHFIIFLISLLLEIFIFNIRTYQSLLYDTKDWSEFEYQMIQADELTEGFYQVENDSMFVFFMVMRFGIMFTIVFLTGITR